MRRRCSGISVTAFGCILLLLRPLTSVAGWADDIAYVSPLPGAQWVRGETNIIVRWRGVERVHPASLGGMFTVTGSSSGRHDGSAAVSDDGRTVIFQPVVPFQAGERVDLALSGPGGRAFSMSFFVSEESHVVPADPLRNECCRLPDVRVTRGQQASTSSSGSVLSNALPVPAKPSPFEVSLPSDFPLVNVTVMDSPGDGKIFINNWAGNPYLLILESDGTPVFYRRMPAYARDFKVQPTGVLTYQQAGTTNLYFAMDSSYTVIDTFWCGNGYETDEHELEMLTNGHVLLIGRDYQKVDMSQIIVGGNRNATVIGNIVQELDTQHRVVFEWRTWDHYEITDCLELNSRASLIDYAHINSIDVDRDSNIIISTRNLSEVTKINRQTGEVMWRLGGKNTMFTLVNDALGFSYQHDARSLGGGRYTVFDNGNKHRPQFSRAVEYALDTVAMTATLVWEYRHSPDRYTWWMGNVQRLPNGNSVIGWGDGSLPKMTEVRPDGTKAYELDFMDVAHCYRVFRFPWAGRAAVPYLIAEPRQDRVILFLNTFGDSTVVRYRIYGGILPNPTQCIDSAVSSRHELTELQDGMTYYFRATAVRGDGTESGLSNEVSARTRYVEPGQNMLVNGDFTEGIQYWSLEQRDGAVAAPSVTAAGEYFLSIGLGGPQYGSLQVTQGGCQLVKGNQYILEFDAYASATRAIEAKVEQSVSPWTNYSQTGTIGLTSTRRHFSFPFTMAAPTDLDARVVFSCGKSLVDVYFDNVSLREVLPTGVRVHVRELPERYELCGAYPNPFNPATVIRYALPAPAHVTVTVYDLLGQTVTRVVDSSKEAGVHEAVFRAEGLSSGLYLCRMEAEQAQGGYRFTAAVKILLIK